MPSLHALLSQKKFARAVAAGSVALAAGGIVLLRAPAPGGAAPHRDPAHVVTSSAGTPVAPGTISVMINGESRSASSVIAAKSLAKLARPSRFALNVTPSGPANTPIRAVPIDS